jgi:hypothetical protein
LSTKTAEAVSFGGAMACWPNAWPQISATAAITLHLVGNSTLVATLRQEKTWSLSPPRGEEERASSLLEAKCCMPRKSLHAPILRGVGRALAERLDEIVNLGLPKRLVKLLRSLESQERSSALSQATTPSRSPLAGISGTQQPTGNDPPPED